MAVSLKAVLARLEMQQIMADMRAAWERPILSPHEQLLDDLEYLMLDLQAGAESDDCEAIVEIARDAEDECHRLIAEAPNVLFCGEPLGTLHGGATNARKARTLHDGLALVLGELNCAITGGGDATDKSDDLQNAAWIVEAVVARLEAKQ